MDTETTTTIIIESTTVSSIQSTDCASLQAIITSQTMTVTLSNSVTDTAINTVNSIVDITQSSGHSLAHTDVRQQSLAIIEVDQDPAADVAITDQDHDNVIDIEDLYPLDASKTEFYACNDSQPQFGQ